MPLGICGSLDWNFLVLLSKVIPFSGTISGSKLIAGNFVTFAGPSSFLIEHGDGPVSTCNYWAYPEIKTCRRRKFHPPVMVRMDRHLLPTPCDSRLVFSPHPAGIGSG